MKVKDKYMIDFLKFVQITLGRIIKTNVENGEWDIFNPITKNCIGSIIPSNGVIQIFNNEMYEIAINYLQLGFELDVFEI